MNFDDQDWDLEERASRPATDSAGVWKVAAGVAVGIVIGGALVWALDRHPAGRDDTPVAMTTATAMSTVAAIDVNPAAAEATVSESPQAVVLAPAAAPRAAETGAAQALRSAQQAAERKERAWSLSYKKPAACEESPPKASLVECANHFIRAKREFEQLYAVSKPGPSRSDLSASRSAPAP